MDFRDIWAKELIANDTTVLDIGCGSGELLAFLETACHIKGQGIEIDADKVSTAAQAGLPVIQGDADLDLAHFNDQSFQVAILARTVQAMKQPKSVLEQALRIANKVIVVIPNFGHIRNRLYLLTRGRMPVTSSLSYQWYETPNIHFCTIKDMVALAEEVGATVEARYTLSHNRLKPFAGNGHLGANLFGEEGVFVLSRDVVKR